MLTVLFISAPTFYVREVSNLLNLDWKQNLSQLQKLKTENSDVPIYFDRLDLGI